LTIKKIKINFAVGSFRSIHGGTMQDTIENLTEDSLLQVVGGDTDWLACALGAAAIVAAIALAPVTIPLTIAAVGATAVSLACSATYAAEQICKK
jgi:hypothetical protein